MKKEKVVTVLSCLFVFLISFLFFIYVYGISVDEVWVYGFSHNIRTHLVPYRDFHMVVFPLYSFLMAMFLWIKDSIVFFHLGNAFLFMALFYLLRKMDGALSWFIILFLLLSFVTPTYNILALFFLFLLVYLEEKNFRYRDFGIGIILGLLLLTKHNIGVVCLLPTLYLAFQKRCSLKLRIFGCSLPLVCFLLYLLLNNSLYACLNDTIFGLFEFGQKNGQYGIWTLGIIFFFFSFCYLWYFKKEKRISLLYSVCFLFLSFPLFDFPHFIISIMPFVFFLLQGKLSFFKSWVTPIFSVLLLSSVVVRSVTLHLSRFDTMESEPTRFLHYKFASSTYLENIRTIKNYLQRVDGDFYIFNHQAYLIKIEMDIPIHLFDLINRGNLGYRGEEKLIQNLEDVCSKEKCTFLIATDELDGKNIGQTSWKILSYVIENYQKKEEVAFFTVFENSVK